MGVNTVGAWSHLANVLMNSRDKTAILTPFFVVLGFPSCVIPHKNGTLGEDQITGVAVAEDGSIIVGGFTNSAFGSDHLGGFDLMAAGLDPSTGSLAWAWQVSD